MPPTKEKDNGALRKIGEAIGEIKQEFVSKLNDISAQLVEEIKESSSERRITKEVLALLTKNVSKLMDDNEKTAQRSMEDISFVQGIAIQVKNDMRETSEQYEIILNKLSTIPCLAKETELLHIDCPAGKLGHLEGREVDINKPLEENEIKL